MKSKLLILCVSLAVAATLIASTSYTTRASGISYNGTSIDANLMQLQHQSILLLVGQVIQQQLKLLLGEQYHQILRIKCNTELKVQPLGSSLASV